MSEKTPAPKPERVPKSRSDSPEQRPRDFDEVLASASDASAYARQDCDYLDDSAGDGVSAIRLDLKRLSDMVECIPLPERLGVSSDLFLPEQVAEFERIAKQRLKTFDERVKSIANSEIRSDRGMSDAERDLNKVKSTLKPRVPGSENNDNNEGGEDDDDDEDGLNPDDIVDWLDKVLAK